MQPMRANELLAGLTLAENEIITGVVTDSRQVIPGCVFVCFPGAKVDGHDFALQAYRSGARYIVANHPVPGVPERCTVLVQDQNLAMLRMAANYRMLFSPLMIGVTGSVGKTTTKEFCYAVLSTFGNTLRSDANHNNDLGLSWTLFELESTHEYAVLEMGMSGLGEIERLSRAARPAAGIITTVGVSHLEQLVTRENILKAKLEICAGLPDEAPLILNADNDLLAQARLPGRLRPVWFSANPENDTADVRAVSVRQGAQSTTFTIFDTEFGSLPAVTIPTVGVHTVRDALAAYAAATRLGLEPVRCAAALANYVPSGMRQNIKKCGDITVIEDCYNACPESMFAALQVLKLRPEKRHVALLGDMLELGSVAQEAHRAVGKQVAQTGVDTLITYGDLGAQIGKAAAEEGVTTVHCQTAKDVVNCLQQLNPGDVLLVKASHAMGLEAILEDYYRVAAQK